jgi:hypothetical protein
LNTLRQTARPNRRGPTLAAISTSSVWRFIDELIKHGAQISGQEAILRRRLAQLVPAGGGSLSLAR